MRADVPANLRKTSSGSTGTIEDATYSAAFNGRGGDSSLCEFTSLAPILSASDSSSLLDGIRNPSRDSKRSSSSQTMRDCVRATTLARCSTLIVIFFLLLPPFFPQRISSTRTQTLTLCVFVVLVPSLFTCFSLVTCHVLHAHSRFSSGVNPLSTRQTSRDIHFCVGCDQPRFSLPTGNGLHGPRLFCCCKFM